jgi:hypothetical protein
MHAALTILKALLMLAAIACFVAGTLKAMRDKRFLRAFKIIAVAFLLIVIFVILELLTKNTK